MFRWLLPAPQQQLALASAQLLQELEIRLTQEKLEQIISAWAESDWLRFHFEAGYYSSGRAAITTGDDPGTKKKTKKTLSRLFARASSTSKGKKQQSSPETDVSAEGSRLQNKSSVADSPASRIRSFSGAKSEKNEKEYNAIRDALASSRLLHQADLAGASSGRKLTEKPEARKLSGESGILDELIKAMPETSFGEGIRIDVYR
jgi:hypothetical protein